MKKFDPQELCLSFLTAESEKEIEELLKKYSLLNDPTLWRDLGDNPNNYSIVGNQQAEPDLALIEKLTNSVDAILLGEVRARGIDPEGPDAPQSIREAAAKYVLGLDDPHYSFADIPVEKMVDIAERIGLIASGSTRTPNFTIFDSGEGQTPDAMPDTLLSLQASNKNRIPFVQGKFNMGGSGALRFAGEYGTQLIVSKRRPELTGKSERDGSWGFTIVRRFPPQANERKSVYRYLAPIGAKEQPQQGNVLAFAAADIPGGVNDMEYGTVIKLFDYDAQGFRGPTTELTNLSGRLNGLFADPPIPFGNYENRKFDRPIESGVVVWGIRNMISSTPDALEPNFPVHTSLVIDKEKMDVSIYAFSQKIHNPLKSDQGVVFLVNGQLHGKLPNSFFGSQNIGYSYLEKTLFVVVDCSHLSTQFSEKLFFGSRDRVSFSSEAGQKLKEGLTQIIKATPSLEDLNAARREQALGKVIEFDKIGKNLLQKLIHDSPWLSDVLKQGNLVNRLTNTIEKELDLLPTEEETGANGDVPTVEDQENYEGKLYPTFFSFAEGQKTDAPISVSVGKTVKLLLETDAVDDYFTRRKSPGEFKIYAERKHEIIDIPSYKGPMLHHGHASVSFKIPEEWDIPADKNYTLWLKVNDVSQKQPFVNTCKLLIVPPPALDNTDAEGVEEETRIGGPRISWVDKRDWANFGMDEESAVRVMVTYPKGRPHYDFFVNRDNVHLHKEVAKKETAPDALKGMFKISLVTLALSSIRGARIRQQFLETTKPPNISQEVLDKTITDKIQTYVARQTDNAAPIILPLLRTMSVIVADGIIQNTDIGKSPARTINGPKRKLISSEHS